MKERPILFSTPMVQAILDGQKTVTRRVVDMKFCEPGCRPWIYLARCDDYPGSEFFGQWEFRVFPHNEALQYFVRRTRCPYGVPGDRLWVKETYHLHRIHDQTKASKVLPTLLRDIGYVADENLPPGIGKCRPSIFMPRWASRILLEIASVRVERLQDITNNDAQAEGFPGERGDNCPDVEPWEQFRDLWDHLNAKRGVGWDVNPWVWRIEFRRV